MPCKKEEDQRSKHMADGLPVENVFVGITTLIMCIDVAWACLKLVDEPARAWLKEHWLKK